MKNFFKLILLLAVLCIPAVTYADESAMIQNKALSDQ